MAAAPEAASTAPRPGTKGKPAPATADNAIPTMGGEAASPTASAPVTSALSLTLTLHKPLVARPPTPPPLPPAVADVVPPRVPALRAPPRPDAVEAFRREMQAAAERVVDAYRACVGEAAAATTAGEYATPPPAGALPQAVVASLQATGAYGAIVADMRAAAERVVREHFADAPGAGDPPGSAGRDAFEAWTYAFLSDQLNVALARAADAAGRPPAPTPEQAAAARREAAATKLRVAAECELSGEVDRAEALLKSRVMDAERAAAAGAAGGRFDAQVWHDLGRFYARRGNVRMAHVCLRQAVACDGAHAPALLALAAVRASQGSHHEAAVLAANAVRLWEAAASAEAAAPSLSSSSSPTASPSSDVLAVVHAATSVVLEAGGDTAAAGRSLGAAVTRLQQHLTAAGVDDDAVAATATAGAAYLRAASYFLRLGGAPRLAAVALQHAVDAFTDPPAPTPAAQQAQLVTLQARLCLATHGVDTGGADAAAAAPSPAQCAARLRRVVEADESCAGAWLCLADLMQAGLLDGSGVGAHRPAAAVAAPLDVHGLPAHTRAEITRLLQMAVAATTTTVAGDDAQRRQQRWEEEGLQAALGGAACPPDPSAPSVLYLRLAGLQLAEAAPAAATSGSADPGAALGALSAAREALLRAASAECGGSVGGWAAVPYGLGRVALGAGDAREADRQLLAAHQRDPHDGAIVGHMALAALAERPPRVGEARLLAEQALSLGLAGDTAGRAHLLQDLASALLRHRGQQQQPRVAAVAEALLERASRTGGGSGGSVMSAAATP